MVPPDSLLVAVHRAGKLSLIDPSAAIAHSYARKSESSLRAADVLFDAGLLEESIVMIYYAMYHEATALLRHIGIKCENHNATILLLEQFGIPNDALKMAKQERIDKQYYPDVLVVREDAQVLRGTAQRFIDQMTFYREKLTRERKDQLRARVAKICDGV
jgi:uncharacterized protein (UPF0332 family)